MTTEASRVGACIAHVHVQPVDALAVDVMEAAFDTETPAAVVEHIRKAEKAAGALSQRAEKAKVKRDFAPRSGSCLQISRYRRPSAKGRD